MAINHQDDDMVINFEYQEGTTGGIVYKLQYYKNNNVPTVAVQKQSEEAREWPAEMFLEVADFLREKVYKQKTVVPAGDAAPVSPGGIPLPVVDNAGEEHSTATPPFESFAGNEFNSQTSNGLQLPEVSNTEEAVPEAPLVSEEDIQSLLEERAQAAAKAQEKPITRT